MSLLKMSQEDMTPTNRYINNFIFNEDIQEKRFDRYVAKTKEFLFDFLRTNFRVGESVETGLNFNDVIVAFFKSYYYPIVFKKDGEEEKNQEDVRDEAYRKIFGPKGRCLLDCVHSYFVPYFDSITVDKDSVIFIFENPNAQIIKGCSFYTIIDAEFEYCCKLHISRKSCLDGHINEGNYTTQTKLESDLEAINFIVDLVNLILIDIERLLHSRYREGYSQVLINDEVKGLKDKISENEKKEKEYLQTIKENKQEITTLKSKLAEANARNEKKTESDIVKALTDSNTKIRKQKEKYIERYNELVEKYNRLKNQVNVEEESIEKMEELKEVDVNLNYLFACYDDVSFFDQIKKGFPNATFISDNSIIKSNVDYVIVLTEHIDHSAYYGLRAQCTNRNIPFIHCVYTNTERIKDVIKDFIN